MFFYSYYNLYREGEFVLYRHKTLPYSVHAMYRQCPGGASCNCAVAVRIEDDVLVVDKCGPSAASSTATYPIKVKLFRNGKLHPGFKVYQYFQGRMVKVGFT